MCKFLCSVSLLLSTCCLSLNVLTVLPSRRLSAVQADSKFERKSTSRLLARLPEFSPIDSHGIVAKLLAERVKLSRIRQNYMLLQKLYVVSPYIKVWPSETIQSFSSASRTTTGSSSGRSAASTDSSGASDDSSDSNCTISSHGSRLLSPSSDSDDRS